MKAILAEPTRSVEHGFYRHAMQSLEEGKVPFLVGGAYAFRIYTGIERYTKDIDLFVKPADYRRALRVLSRAGYRTEATASQWLGKAFHKGYFVDLILGFANGIGQMDESWFERAPIGSILGLSARFVAPEEMIWMKAFVQARDRYDGADVAHLLRACHKELDWPKLIQRFEKHWRVLLSHLILFGFIYPGERDRIPVFVMRDLEARLRREQAQPHPFKVCQGTLLTHSEYKTDVGRWRYRDARPVRHRKNLEAKSVLPG